MLGAVVLEHPPQVRKAADRDDVADEDRRAQDALDEPEQQRRAELVLDQARGGDRDDEEEPDRERQRAGDRQRPGEPSDRLRGGALLGLELGVGRDAERPKADFQRLAECDDASNHRQAQQTVAVCPRDQRLGGDLDLTRCATEPGAPIGIDQVLGAGLSNRDRPGRDAPHHHALEHRLATDGGVAQGDRHAVGHARGVDLWGLGD